MHLRRTSLLITVAVLIVGIVLGMQIQAVVSGDNTFQQLRKLEEAFSFITKRYVEDVDSAKLVEDAIEGMLQGLDPHSHYVDAQRMARMREQFDASFEGVGIYYDWTPGSAGKDTLTVLMPITGGPSEEAGLVPGDRIVQVDDIDAVGWTTEDVERHLKGPKGTTVDVIVVRPGYRSPMEFTITRDQLPIHTLDASYMLDDHTGYIRLQRFARTTYDEFMEALNNLQRQGMERLVLDLRGNAGGYMEMAINISNEFLKSGEMIVYTRSRHADLNREYRARPGGSLQDNALIILVDEFSASASEIVAGAVQDHDRGLIVGRRTFGKGLVQQQFPMSDGSVLQMTISKYYTPSGRLIQTPYVDIDREEFRVQTIERLQSERVMDVQDIVREAPDSLKFETDRGRVVLGGGGILPDYIIPADSTPAIVEAVYMKRLDREFGREWVDEHGVSFRDEWRDRKQEFIRDFRLSDSDWQDFVEFMLESGIEISDADAAVPEDLVFTAAELEENRHVIETRIKADIARRLFDVGTWYIVMHQIDKTLQEAMRLWSPAEELAAFHMSSTGR